MLNRKVEFLATWIIHSAKVLLGKAMKELGYEHTEHGHVAFDKAIPLKAA